METCLLFPNFLMDIWYGHVEIMDPTRLPKILINWKPERKKKKKEAVPKEPGKMGYVQPWVKEI